MKPRDHVILGALGAAALYPWMGKHSAVFWAASVLIDLDHYLDFLWHNRFTDLSVKRMFEYHVWLESQWKRPEFLNIEVFHTVELLVPLFALAHWASSPALLAVCMGFAFHISLDMVYLTRKGVPFIRAYSFTEYLIRRRMLIKRLGLAPAQLYSEAVRSTREAR